MSKTTPLIQHSFHDTTGSEELFVFFLPQNCNVKMLTNAVLQVRQQADGPVGMVWN